MASTLTVLTLRLAEALGLYWLAAGVGLLLSPARLAAMVDSLEASPALVWVTGLATFAIGTAILIPHHLLADPLSIVVTLVAAVVAVEGLVLLAFPAPLLALARPFVGHARLWGIVSVVLGAILFLAGLTGRADYIPQGV